MSRPAFALFGKTGIDDGGSPVIEMIIGKNLATARMEPRRFAGSKRAGASDKPRLILRHAGPKALELR